MTFWCDQGDLTSWQYPSSAAASKHGTYATSSFITIEKGMDFCIRASGEGFSLTYKPFGEAQDFMAKSKALIIVFAIANVNKNTTLVVDSLKEKAYHWMEIYFFVQSVF